MEGSGGYLSIGSALLHHREVFGRCEGGRRVGIGIEGVRLLVGRLLLLTLLRVQVVRASLLLRILLRLRAAVLKPILFTSQREDPLSHCDGSTYIDLVQRDIERLSKALLRVGARLVLLLKMRLQDVVLLLGQARLDVARHLRRHGRVPVHAVLMVVLLRQLPAAVDIGMEGGGMVVVVQMAVLLLLLLLVAGGRRDEGHVHATARLDARPGSSTITQARRAGR